MKIIAAVSVFALAVGAGIYVYSTNRDGDNIPANVNNSAVAGHTAPATTARVEQEAIVELTPESAPAWLQPANPKPVPSSANTAGVNSSQTARMELAMSRLQHLQAAGSTDPKQIASALLQVEQANGSPVLQGVRLDILRQNLEVAERMKEIATQLSAMQPSDKTPLSAEATAAVRVKMDQLSSLQKQLRSDVMQNAHMAGNAP